MHIILVLGFRGTLRNCVIERGLALGKSQSHQLPGMPGYFGAEKDPTAGCADKALKVLSTFPLALPLVQVHLAGEMNDLMTQLSLR